MTDHPLLHELKASRARILAASDGERRRIERDLHDGAQQRLVALKIRLDLAADRLEGGDPGTAALLRGLAEQAETALEEIRTLARGLHPPVLADHGLAAALRAVSRTSALPATVLARAGRRYQPEIETAAYFCCLEAMQNASKHAPKATGIRITISEHAAQLRVEVRDDGPGFDARRAAPGAGLTNMRDRVAVLGGRLRIDARPGAGTRVLLTFPLDLPELPACARAGSAASA